MEIQEALNED